MLIVHDDALFSKAQLEKEFKAKMKEQERAAIQALLVAKELQIGAKYMELETQLGLAASNMKNYASQTYVNNIKEGFSGAAAQAAETYLTQLQAPSLKNPIKAGG
ncbi:hypothetical protein ACVRXQ_05110 [Streptococcus panodentis]|uniref:Uncharacterized protein n=1 Tax=Streptococcus panodentis TaxID=1581472 RepID=A0ABS5AWC8_9STRE|nr:MULTISPECIES: hypothetical protein [Streptococcus]KXT84534.1 hypothetical protein STRDD11_00925 [Streptococcus sp. DD11]MBP2620878.1 hypothetical protein [Streptococcus panodentis]